MSSAENDHASRLIERLLVDPDFRAEFRRDPVGACEAAGLPELAAELAGTGRPMDTLVVRESRSSLAGVVMAVAVEGMSVAEAQALMHHGVTGLPHGKLPHGVLPSNLAHGGPLHNPLGHVHHAAAPAALQRELRHDLHAGAPAHAGGGAAPAPAGDASAPAAGGAPAAASGAPAASAGAPAAAGGGAPAASGGAPAAAGGGTAAAAQSAGSAPSSGVVHADAPAAAGRAPAAGGFGGAGVQQPAPGVAWPDQAPAGAAGSPGAAPPVASAPVTGPPTGAPAPGGPGALPATPEPAPPNPGAQPIDGGAVAAWPDQHMGGSAGGGGLPIGGGALGASGGAGGLAALLQSPNLSAPPNVRTFLASGGVDPRMVSVLDSALANHSIGLGQVVALSDPVHVQSVDIVSVDGQPVGPDNLAARDLVTEIAALDPSERPSEIGTPWPIRSQGFFSDAGAMNRLHLAFEMPGTDSPPAGGGVQAVGAMTSPAAGQVAYPAPVAGQVGTPVAGQVGTPVAGQVGAPEVQVLAGQPAVGNLSEMAPGSVPLSSVVPAPIAAATPGSGPDAALAYARAMIGKLPESAGSNLGPQLDKFESDFGFHGAPWCGIFAGHVMEAAGLHVPHSVASVASILDLARNGDPPFVKGVLPISEAQPGDLATFGGTEHVAVITKVDAAGVHTIAGNTGQSNVSETVYSPGSVTGVVRPDYAAGTPGSIPGVWDYAGAQPPGAGTAPPVPGAAPPVPGAAPVVPAAAPAVPAAAPPVAEPLANAPAPAAQAAAPAQPDAAAFNAPGAGHRSFGRHTVQFLPAVQPSPGSPLFGQAPHLAAAPQAAAPEAAVPQAGVPAPSAGGAQPMEAPVAGQPGAADVLGQAPAPAGSSISVSSTLLTPGQAKFAGRLAELTGLDPHVVAAWELAEESGSAAQGREAASNFNWLNIGYFDSGAGKIAFDKEFGDPVSAAEQTARFLKGEWGGASSSIRAILSTVGHSPDEQMSAIANSDWASSHYGGGANLHGTYNELGDIHIETTAVA